MSSLCKANSSVKDNETPTHCQRAERTWSVSWGQPLPMNLRDVEFQEDYRSGYDNIVEDFFRPSLSRSFPNSFPFKPGRAAGSTGPRPSGAIKPQTRPVSSRTITAQESTSLHTWQPCSLNGVRFSRRVSRSASSGSEVTPSFGIEEVLKLVQLRFFENACELTAGTALHVRKH